MKNTTPSIGRGRIMRWAWCAMLPALTACALMTKAEPLQLRFFSPAQLQSPQSSVGVRHTDPVPLLELRIGQVVAASHIEQRIAYRRSANELGYYDSLRWTESPDAYLKRTLAEALFDERGVGRIVSGPGPTLDVELQSFEELSYANPRVRVALRFVLRDEHRALRERSLLVERPFDKRDAEDAPERLSEAMALALEQIVNDVADQILSELTAHVAKVPKETLAHDATVGNAAGPAATR